MKVNLDIKNKKGSLEADVEKLVEKGMDNHEKDWKDKFKTKHEAKKELMEIKHKNKMEQENQKLKKKGFFERRAEEKARLKELEIEQKRIEYEQKLAEKRKKTKISITLMVTGVILLIIGVFAGSASNDSDSPWYIFAIIGLFVSSGGILLLEGLFEPKKKKK